MIIGPILVVIGTTILGTVMISEDKEDKNAELISQVYKEENIQIEGIYPKFVSKEKGKWGAVYYFEVPPTLANAQIGSLINKLEEKLKRKVVLTRDKYGKIVIQVVKKAREKEFEEFKENFGCTRNLSCEMSTREVTCSTCSCRECCN